MAQKTIKAPSVYEEIITIDSGSVDHNLEVKLSGIQRIFQEVAGNHTKLMKIGFLDLLEKELSWVITKLKTTIIRKPKLYEELTFRTWPRKPGSILAERDFEVEDANGNIIVRSTSMWCLISNITRRAVRIVDFPHNEPDYIEDRTLEFSFPNYFGIKLEEQKHFESSRTVKLSDLDLNGHMNNTIYVDLVFDVLTKEEYDNYLVEGLYMKYKREAKYGDRITVKKYLIQDLVCVKGFVGETEIFEAVLDLLTAEEREERKNNPQKQQ